MKRIGILLLVFSSMSFTLFAQQRTIMGTIVDSETMLPLVGVSIMGDSTNNGCTTDIDGKFSMKTTNEVKCLVLSYIGYEKKKIVTSVVNPCTLATVSTIRFFLLPTF